MEHRENDSTVRKPNEATSVAVIVQCNMMLAVIPNSYLVLYWSTAGSRPNHLPMLLRDKRARHVLECPNLKIATVSL